MVTLESEQLSLPIEIREPRKVWWINVKQVETRSRFLGRRMLKTEFEKGQNGLPSTTEIPVDDINELKDPDLRYSLRFQDAAETTGWFSHGGGHSSSHFVTVEATNEGVDSRLIGTTITGRGEGESDTFMENLRRFAPDYNGNYGN